MSAGTCIREGQVLSGPLFSEPMRVETVRPNGPGVWVAGVVGQRSEQFRLVTLTSDDISNLEAATALEESGFFIRKIGTDGYRIHHQATLKKVVSDRLASLDEKTEIRPAIPQTRLPARWRHEISHGVQRRFQRRQVDT